jgi:hypothetical protein
MVRGWYYRAGEAAHQKKRTEEDVGTNDSSGLPKSIMPRIIEKAGGAVKQTPPRVSARTRRLQGVRRIYTS